MVITKRPSSLRWNLGSVSSEATHGSCVLEVIKLVSCAGNYSWSHVEVTQVVLVLKFVKGSWGATEACHCVADLEPLKRAWRGCWWKCSPVVARDSSISEMSGPWDSCQEQQQWWSGANLSLGDSLCELRRLEPEMWPGSFGGVMKTQWIPDFGHWVIYTAEIWFCSVQIVTVPWFFPREVRKRFVTFYFIGAHSCSL